jgi:hypothetical protein
LVIPYNNHFVKEDELEFTSPSANSNQNCSNAFSGLSFCLLPDIIEAFTAPIDVPATISIFILFSTNVLKTPHAKAPKEPPP